MTTVSCSIDARTMRSLRRDKKKEEDEKKKEEEGSVVDTRDEELVRLYRDSLTAGFTPVGKAIDEELLKAGQQNTLRWMVLQSVKKSRMDTEERSRIEKEHLQVALTNLVEYAIPTQKSLMWRWSQCLP